MYSKQEEYEGNSNNVALGEKPSPIVSESVAEERIQSVVPQSPGGGGGRIGITNQSPTRIIQSKYSPEEKQVPERIRDPSPSSAWSTTTGGKPPQFKSEVLRQLSQEMEQEQESNSSGYGSRPYEVASTIATPRPAPIETTDIREQFHFMPTTADQQPMYADATSTVLQDTRNQMQMPTEYATQQLQQQQQPIQQIETQQQYIGPSSIAADTTNYETQPQYDPNSQSQYRYETGYQQIDPAGYPIEYQSQYQYEQPNNQLQPSIEQSQYEQQQQQYINSTGIPYEQQYQQEYQQPISTLPGSASGSTSDLTAAPSSIVRRQSSQENVAAAGSPSGPPSTVASASPNQSPPSGGPGGSNRSKKSPSPPNKSVVFEQPITEINQSITKQSPTAPTPTTTAARRGTATRAFAARQANARARAQAAAAARGGTTPR